MGGSPSNVLCASISDVMGMLHYEQFTHEYMDTQHYLNKQEG